MTGQFVLGTRGSALALFQAKFVKALIQREFPELDVQLEIITTEGDTDRTSSLASFGGRGAFVRTIETALLDVRIDAAVHSLKDLPSRLPEGLMLVAAPAREDPRDALVTRDGRTFAELPTGSRIGTGSDRRRAQLERLRDDLEFLDLRGNVDTRLKKLGAGDYDGIVLAAAGLCRLGYSDRISHYFDTGDVLPAAGQGAIGVECRADNTIARAVCGEIDDAAVRICVDAEREFIAALGLGCHAPVGAFARIKDDMIVFTGFASCVTPRFFMRDTVRVEQGDACSAAADMGKKFRDAAPPEITDTSPMET